MTRTILYACLFACAIGAAACGSGAHAGDVRAAPTEALLEADARFAEWAATGDPRRFDIWVDEGIIYRIGQAPIVGKPAIRSFFEENARLPNFEVSWEVADVAAPDGGDFGLTMGDGELAFDAGDARVRVVGPYVMAWARRDGEWKALALFNYGRPVTD